MMSMGIIDDIAVLEQPHIRNKHKIIQRKSLYSQLQKQIKGMEEEIKKLKGTNETLERQVIQSNIKSKTMAQASEVERQTMASKANIYKQELESKAQQKLYRNILEKEMLDSRDKINKMNDENID